MSIHLGECEFFKDFFSMKLLKYPGLYEMDNLLPENCLFKLIYIN